MPQYALEYEDPQIDTAELEGEESDPYVVLDLVIEQMQAKDDKAALSAAEKIISAKGVVRHTGGMKDHEHRARPLKLSETVTGRIIKVW